MLLRIPLTLARTLSLHDALPICIDPKSAPIEGDTHTTATIAPITRDHTVRARGVRTTVNRHSTAISAEDRKSTRLNSSHVAISYAVICLKKKNELQRHL